MHTADTIAQSARLGWMPFYPQFGRNPLDLADEAIAANPDAPIDHVVQQITDQQIRMSNELANPTRMVQIAMAVKDVAFSDITFIQYPTGYVQGGGGGRVVPLTDAAQVLFTALEQNRPIMLTGKTSPGASNSQEVKGEVTPQPTASPNATASPGATAGPVDAPADAVALPDVITGQTANQITCTLKEHG